MLDLHSQNQEPRNPLSALRVPTHCRPGSFQDPDVWTSQSCDPRASEAPELSTPALNPAAPQPLSPHLRAASNLVPPDFAQPEPAGDSCEEKFNSMRFVA